MKLSTLLTGAATVAFVAGVASSAFAATPQSNTGPVSQSFTITGHVVTGCLLTLPASESLGTIPVNLNASTSASTYFHMTDAAGDSVYDTSGKAGCNSNSTVLIAKTNGATGLHNSTTAGYDSAVFTQDLPYYASVGWQGVYDFVHGPQTAIPMGLTAAPNEASHSVGTGAFASAMNISILLPQNAKGLLAGDYSDTVTVTLTPN